MKSNNNIDIISSFKDLWLKVKNITNYIMESPKIVIKNMYNYFHNTTKVHNQVSKKPLIDYEQMYHDVDAQVQHLSKEVVFLKSIHEQHLKDAIQDHNNALELQDKNNSILLKKAHLEKEEVITQKQELQNKYINLITQIETLITERDQQNEDIIKLRVELKEISELIRLTESEKTRLENEMLILNDRLIGQSEITERENKEYARKHNYMPPREAQKLTENNNRITKINEQLQHTIDVLKNEINKGYDDDVKISQKLVTYITDIKIISEDITKLNGNLQIITTTKAELTNKITYQSHEIAIYGIIDSKTHYSQKDIEALSERMTNIKRCETLIENYKIQLYDESRKEVIINERLKDQRILYSKRHDLIMDQIRMWIEDKSTYYSNYSIPFKTEDNQDLKKYVEELKRISKFPSEIDKDKKEYNYKEYDHYIRERNYENIISKHQPDILRFNNERALIITKPVSPLKQPQEITLQMKEKYLKEMAQKPVVSSAQQTLNEQMLRSIQYTPKPLTIGNSHRSIPYRPSNYNPTTTLTKSIILDKSNNNNTVNNATNKTNTQEGFLVDID